MQANPVEHIFLVGGFAESELLQTLIELRIEFIWNQTKFVFDVYRHSPEIFTVSANGSLVQAKLQVVPGGSFSCVFGGTAHAFHYEEEPGDKLRLTIDEQVVTLEPEVTRPSRPSSPRSPTTPSPSNYQAGPSTRLGYSGRGPSRLCRAVACTCPRPSPRRRSRKARGRPPSWRRGTRARRRARA